MIGGAGKGKRGKISQAKKINRKITKKGRARKGKR
jgi:hypothetical protein